MVELGYASFRPHSRDERARALRLDSRRADVCFRTTTSTPSLAELT